MPHVVPPLFVFPTFLLPNIPFRRRSSTATVNSDSSSIQGRGASVSSSPPLQPTYLTGHTSLLRCSRCLAHICSTDQIISKGFTGRHGRAYLVAPSNAGAAISVAAEVPKSQSIANLPNTLVHKPVPRQLVTGAHTVSDISCVVCTTVLGWKYVAAEEESQRYKVGKFILETKRVLRGICWEHGDNNGGEAHIIRAKDGTIGFGHGSPDADIKKDDGIDFDSQDEDECEDLFMGIWSESLARKRRQAKTWRKNE